MHKFVMGALALAVAASAAFIAQPSLSADAPTVTRKVLMQQDVQTGNTMVLIEVTIPVGGREGKHTHPGPLMVYVKSGAISLDYEGKPNVTYKAGESFFVEAGKIHEGINRGTEPAVALATGVAPKGQPLTTQVN